MSERYTRAQVIERLQISGITGLISFIRATSGKYERMLFTKSDISAYQQRNRQNAAQ